MASNPNQVLYPYGGGTDNPSESTAYTNPGGPTNVAATETGTPSAVVAPPTYPIGLSTRHSDTVLPAGVQAVPLVASGFESAVDRGADTGGVTVDPSGNVRVSGQDEVQGETETTTGQTPSAFPEPNP